MPVGIVETEELGALELEVGDAPAARLEGSPDLVELRAHTGTTTAATVSAPMRPARHQSASSRFMSPTISRYTLSCPGTERARPGSRR